MIRLSEGSKWIARLAVVMFLFWIFCFGGLIAGIALHDSDTCWLLAMGRWIVEHKALPFVDPFSSGVSLYDTIASGLPLVQYQWLAEIFFYLVYQLGGLTGLLILVSFISFVTFICLPYLFLNKAGQYRLIILWLIFVAAMLASSRLFVRPHTLSFLFLALLMYLYIPSKKAMSQFSWINIVSVAVLMMLWTNTHIFFPLGIVFITMIVMARFLEIRLIDREQYFNRYQFLMPIVALLATLINPWGKDIWAYVQRLRTCPTNYLGQEMVPVNLFDLHNLDSIFLLLLIISYIYLLWFYRAFSLRKLGIVSPLLLITGLCMSLQYARLVPVSSLFILAAAAEVTFRQSNRKVTLNDFEQYWEKMLPNKIIWLSTLAIVMMAGTIVIAFAIPPTLPQSSVSFHAPSRAIEFLKAHRPMGKVFNDPQFGSMMTWYLPEADIFYDSRFSQYDPQRMLEYLHIKNCDYGYEKIWQKYNFDWVFIPPSVPLARALREKGWQTIYQDDAAVILTKK